MVTPRPASAPRASGSVSKRACSFMGNSSGCLNFEIGIGASAEIRSQPVTPKARRRCRPSTFLLTFVSNAPEAKFSLRFDCVGQTKESVAATAGTTASNGLMQKQYGHEADEYDRQRAKCSAFELFEGGKAIHMSCGRLKCGATQQKGGGHLFHPTNENEKPRPPQPRQRRRNVTP